MKEVIGKIIVLFGKKGKMPEERRPLMRPFHDWVLLFVLVVLGVVLIVIFSIYIFFVTEGGGFFATEIEGNLPKVGFEESELIKTLENYNKRKEEFDKRLKENKSITDPSI